MKWTKERRDKLATADFGDPARKLFPVEDQEDLDSAVHLVGKSSDPASVKRQLVGIAKRKNLSLPDAWKEKADMSNELIDLALFADEGKEDKGDFVRRPCPVIFRTGTYEFPPLPGQTEKRKWEMTPEDLMAACSSLSGPLEVDDNHRPTHGADGRPVPPSFFRGKLGTVTLRPSEDCSHATGYYDVPKWLDQQYKGLPIPLSPTFDWQTKEFKNVAITHNPRVADAAALPNAAAVFAQLPTADAIFSALAEEEARKAVTPVAIEALPVAAAVPAPVAAFAKTAMTPHGMGALQAAHDIAARAGAVCGAAKKSADMTADFTTQGEHDNLQTIHDAATAGGAQCRTMPVDKDRAGPMVAGYAAEFAAAAMTPREKEMQAKIDAMEADRARQEKARAEAAFSAEVVGGKGRAEAAFTELSRRGAATPAEKAGLVGEYTQAVLDDLIDRQAGKSPEVRFSVDGGAYQSGSREDAVKARWKARPESVLLKQLDDDAGFTVLDDNADASGKRLQEQAGEELAGRCMTAKK